MALAQSHVAAEHNTEVVPVIILHLLMVDPPVWASQVRVEDARNNHAQLMECGVHGAVMALAQSHVVAEHKTEVVPVIILHLLMEDLPVWEKHVRVEDAKNNHAQRNGEDGKNGPVVLNLAQQEHSNVKGYVTGAIVVWEKVYKRETVIRTIVPGGKITTKLMEMYRKTSSQTWEVNHVWKANVCS